MRTFILIGLAAFFAGCNPSSAGLLPTPIGDLSSTPIQIPAPSPTAAFVETSVSPSPANPEIVYLSGLPVESTSMPQPTQSAEEAYPLCSPLSIHPLEELREIISDPYHPPPPGKEQRHQGVDFSYYRRGERTTIQGVGVQSVLPGRVAASIQDKFPYGNMVIIETTPELLSPEIRELLQIPLGESLYTLYAHLNKPPLVDLDKQVDACQSIGEVGKSGNAAEPHLHLEMRLGPAGHSFLSMAYYGAKDTQEERDAYVLWRTSWQFRHFDPMTVLNISH